MKSSKQTIIDFNEEQWKPPDKEDRDLRTNFYGPITDDMLKRALMVDEDEASANSKDNKLETTTYTRPMTAPKIVQIKENCEYFLSWEEKDTTPLPAEDEDDDEKSSITVTSERTSSTMRLPIPPKSMNQSVTSSSVSSVITTKPIVDMTLICFAWEGGNPTIFEKLSAKVKSSLCAGAIYPGRLNRCRETMVDIRESAQETAVALVASGNLIEGRFSFLGHGMGAVYAYEVAMYLRQHYKKQPDLFFIIQAPGPQSFTDDEDFEDDDSDDAGSRTDDGGKLKFWEEDDETLYEHVMTLERGAIHEEADNRELFNFGLECYRSDLRAMASFRYKSDWPLARPLYQVIAHYDGRVSRDDLRTWERETTKELRVYEMCCDGRSMLREEAVVQEFAQWLDARIEEELAREKDPDEDALDALARGET